MIEWRNPMKIPTKKMRWILGLCLTGTLILFFVNRIMHRVIPQFAPAQNHPARGVFHVHTQLSHDSALSTDELATAAAKEGLSFVVLTDHNHQNAGAVVRKGVSLLSYAELSTPYGHVIQLGAPELLTKQERKGINVLERIQQLGGIPVLAHPTDMRRPWVGRVQGAGGIEIADYASSIRRAGGPVFAGLLPALLVWPLKPSLALIQGYDRDEGALRRWDGELDPTIGGYCATSAHGHMPLHHSLRTWQLVLLDALPHHIGKRPKAIINALRTGRYYCIAATTMVKEAPRFSFVAALHKKLKNKNLSQAEPSVALPASNVTALIVRGPVLSNGPKPMIVLLRDGEPVVQQQNTELHYANPTPGTYRVEVRVPLPNILFGNRMLTVIYSNRIRIVADTTPAPLNDP